MSHLVQLLLLLAIVLAASKLGAYLSQRLGQPAVVGSLAAGLILGPSVLNIMGWHIVDFYLFQHMDHFSWSMPNTQSYVPNHSRLISTLSDIAEVGVILLMFLAGLQTDISRVAKQGRVALSAALGGVILPLVFGVTATLGFGIGDPNAPLYAALFIGTVLTATSVSISAETLLELNKLRSREGSAILGAAVIDDVIGILLLSLVIAFSSATGGLSDYSLNLSYWLSSVTNNTTARFMSIVMIVVAMAAYFALAIFARGLLVRFVKWFQRLPIGEGLLSGVLIACLVYAIAAEYIGGVAAITGAFICGVLLNQTELRSDIQDKMYTLAYSFFVPVFFVSIGLFADVRPLFSLTPTLLPWLLPAFALTIIVLAIAGKVLGCWLGAKLTGFTSREAYRVGVGMISRGEVGIIIALVGLRAGIIDETVFSIMVLMVLVTTLITPIWLKRAFAEPKPSEAAPA